MAVQKCPLCKKQYDTIDKLALHIETKHSKEIPANWSGLKYIFYSKHGRTTGKCVVCKKDTPFNEKTGKPNRLCGDPKCVKQMRDKAVDNMIRTRGKATLLDDPEFQNKMLMNRKIAKDYTWSDGSVKRVVGSFEYDGMRFLDIMMGFDSSDVIAPAPFTIEYEYESKPHFYIPDAYITSLNLILEFKDGGDNPNTHPKIQAVDKVKEKAKEDAVRKQGKYHYVKVENKEYDNLLEAIEKIRNMDTVEVVNGKQIMICEESKIITEEIKVIIFKFHNQPLESVGLFMNGTIYYMYGDTVCTTNSAYIDLLKVLYPKVPIYSIKENIRDYIKNEKYYEDEDINEFNFPIVLLFDCLGTDPDALAIARSIDSMTDYDNADVYSKLFENEDRIVLENCDIDELKDIEIDPADITSMELLLLPEEILSEVKKEFPIKGYNFLVNNKENYLDLRKRFEENKIPQCFRESVYNYIYGNNDYNVQENVTAVNLEDHSKTEEQLSEVSNKLTANIQLALDKDGNILLKKHENVDFMSIYSNSHILLKQYVKSGNLGGIKYELCKLWMMKLLTDKIIYGKDKILPTSKQKITDAKKARAFILNDFKTYLDIVLKSDPEFNFTEYFDNTQFGVEVYKIDNRLVKAIKKFIL